MRILSLGFFQVKGQISEMAICLIDDNQTNSTQTIADSAAHFFAELANKGNYWITSFPIWLT